MKKSLFTSLLLIILGPLSAIAQTATNAPASKLPVTVGAEFVVVADGPGKAYRGTPAVAFGGGAYLVAVGMIIAGLGNTKLVQ